jgi:hypothetical protein
VPRNAERIVDWIVGCQDANGLWDRELPGYGSMDSTYLLVRLPRRLGSRRPDAVEALRRLSLALRRLYAQAQEKLLENPHRVLSVVHTFGLLQEAFGDEYRSDRPYRFDWDLLGLYDSEAIRRGRPIRPQETG